MNIFVLLFIYQIKHFVADFPLQNEYMLGKFKEKDWELPLACHAGVHSIFTLLISLMFIGVFGSICLAIFDFVIHFAMDRYKASPKHLGKYTALSKKEFIAGATEEQKKDNVKFWWALGLDQMVHHLTHYIIIYFLI